MSIFLGLILCILSLVTAFPNPIDIPPEEGLDTAVKEPLQGVKSLIMNLDRVLRQISTDQRKEIPTKDDVQGVKSLIMNLERILRAWQISTQKRMGNAS